MALDSFSFAAQQLLDWEVRELTGEERGGSKKKLVLNNLFALETAAIQHARFKLGIGVNFMIAPTPTQVPTLPQRNEIFRLAPLLQQTHDIVLSAGKVPTVSLGEGARSPCRFAASRRGASAAVEGRDPSWPCARTS